MTLVEVGALLQKREETLATAESLTGGALGAAITAIPRASTTYLGGVITYATTLKEQLLGVSEETVSQFGVVSAECAAEMAEGARRATGATWGVSTTGVAGPDEQEGKPVGLVYVGVAGPIGGSGTAVRELRLDGDRNEIRSQTVVEAAKLLLELVGGLARAT